jgi:DNA polymerase II large subunit
VFVSYALIEGGIEMAETGYCVKCKGKKEMKDEQKVTMKNGRSALKGKCPECGTSMFRICGMK